MWTTSPFIYYPTPESFLYYLLPLIILYPTSKYLEYLSPINNLFITPNSKTLDYLSPINNLFITTSPPPQVIFVLSTPLIIQYPTSKNLEYLLPINDLLITPTLQVAYMLNFGTIPPITHYPHPSSCLWTTSPYYSLPPHPSCLHVCVTLDYLPLLFITPTLQVANMLNFGTPSPITHYTHLQVAYGLPPLISHYPHSQVACMYVEHWTTYHQRCWKVKPTPNHVTCGLWASFSTSSWQDVLLSWRPRRIRPLVVL